MILRTKQNFHCYFWDSLYHVEPPPLFNKKEEGKDIEEVVSYILY